ncbi:phosphoglycolate phosphatase [Aeromonas schubertii]|uniref:Phosphoglycolate phosphatase n=1 Tax=Aeromonas schubertii TaxID=652 RepID=A0ABS7V9M2_9GAMM|nr:phosphoglycolate phosphatase [Aeromonas schubertii]MBZ6065623.1 phosphoglycolate phosphatase [Aeromonas schubertii]MBZ6072555.1 phosphoglycolate phosphatase [Aeromonas schubertii]
MSVVEHPFDLVLFDLDGTLIDSVPQLALAVNQMLRECGFDEVPEAVVRTWVGNGADTLVQRALAHAGAGEALFATARPAFGRYYQACLLEGLEMYEGVAATLARLAAAGYRLAVVTNKPTAFVQPILEALGIAGYFSLWLGGNCLPEKKPHPAPLLHACHELQLSPARTLMVGDSENDVLAAKAAGMRVVGLTYGYNYGRPIADSQPDWVFEHFSGLDTILPG